MLLDTHYSSQDNYMSSGHIIKVDRVKIIVQYKLRAYHKGGQSKNNCMSSGYIIKVDSVKTIVWAPGISQRCRKSLRRQYSTWIDVLLHHYPLQIVIIRQYLFYVVTTVSILDRHPSFVFVIIVLFPKNIKNIKNIYIL